MPFSSEEHELGCTPHKPCRNCVIHEFLRRNLNSEAYDAFIELCSDLPPPLPAIDPATPLGVLASELSARAYIGLSGRAGQIKTIGELLRWTEADLLRIPNFGRKSLNEVKLALATRGLRLGSLGP